MSREKKFTPGPWWKSMGLEILKMPEQIKISNFISGSTIKESKANANLIAAAPELLEACENILKVIDCFGMSSCPHVHEVGGCGGEDEDCDWLINAREAIKKAYGETK